MIEIYEKLLLQRRRLKIHQADLAEKIGISEQMMSHLENGRRTIKLPLLEKWANALKLKVDITLTPNNE